MYKRQSIDTGSGVTTIPSSIGELINLETLRLSDTNIEVIPDEVGMLSSLTTLQVSDGDSLISVSTAITNLTNLTSLILNGNENSLTYLPQEICDFGFTLATFEIDDPEICSPYTEEIQKQRDALLSMYNGSALACDDIDNDWSAETDMSNWEGVTSVSYTHLTLPTTSRV